MHFRNEQFHVEAKDHPSKRDADLSSQVVLRSAHCADVKPFLFLKQPVLWLHQRSDGASQQIVVVVQGEWFWKLYKSGGTFTTNSLILSWDYNT